MDTRVAYGIDRGTVGRVTAVRGSVLKVEFLKGLPAINDALRVTGGPRPVTLVLFVGVANLLGLAPRMRAPTADFSTTAALAIIVFLAVPSYGIRARGIRGYLRYYLEPSPFLLPLEIITKLSRTLALAVRLFGNVMSEELIIAVLLGIARFLVPVPIMMLAVLTGVVQAYIFAVLTAVYLSAAVRAHTS
jgi:F-type H+-transporting ATPase subunit a